MRIDVTKQEFEIIVDCLKGQPLKCYRKQRERLARSFEQRLHPPDSNGWAPFKQKRPSIRSSWPTGAVKADKKPDWAFRRQCKVQGEAKVKGVKKPLTADEILAEL